MIAISRSDAADLGQKLFFSGSPCVNGHISERKVSDGKCVECVRASDKRKYQNGSEKIRAARAVYREKNKEAISESKRIYYANNVKQEREKQRQRRAANADQINAKAMERYRANRGVILEQQRNRRLLDIDKARAAERARSLLRRDYSIGYHQAHYLKNREAILERKKRYYEAKPEIIAANRFRRRARKMQALPAWSDELDVFVWQEAAHLVRLRKSATGIDWAADHMIPLAAKTACGLHVGRNCQVIPAYLNNRKNNKLIFTEPFEWMAHV